MCNNIRAARENAGMSQKQAALTLGVSAPTVSDWESGKIFPSAKNLIQLSKLYSVTTDYLLGCETEQPADIEIARGEVLTDEEHDILTKFRLLSSDNRARVSGYLDALADTAPVKKSYNPQVSNA